MSDAYYAAVDTYKETLFHYLRAGASVEAAIENAYIAAEAIAVYVDGLPARYTEPQRPVINKAYRAEESLVPVGGPSPDPGLIPQEVIDRFQPRSAMEALQADTRGYNNAASVSQSPY